jgi:iron complex outermembrane recepter protein
MKLTLRGASGAALIVGLAGGLFPAWAQTVQTTGAGPQETAQTQTAQADQTAPAAPAGGGERIVVTGSLIAGTPEDSALPVEVFSQAELEEQGAPTALEFAKNLTISGFTQGEANFQGGSAPGAVSFNLRGIGAEKSLTLLNGRRVSENASFIPAAALARTELLKDGAAVTYGADAVGGVINFITRDNFVGLEANATYKHIDGSDGDYTASILGGIGEGDTNFLWSVEYEHRSELNPDDRDWALLPFSVNPAPWSPLSNIGVYTPRGALPATVTATGPAGSFTTADEYGAALGAGIYDNNLAIGSRSANCSAVGGAWSAPATPNSGFCRFGYFPFYALVEDQDIYRAFAQVNTAITDDMDFHLDAAYGQVRSATHVSPSLPTSRGPAQAQTGSELFIPRTNPYVAQFLADTGTTLAPTASGFTIGGAASALYRTFAFQGTSAFGDDTSLNEYDYQGWRVSGGIDGRLGDWAGLFSDVNYDVGLTYNQTITRLTAPDMLGHRIQQALNGFGGPNCNAVDLNPNRFGTQNPAAAGRNGCLWLNPFMTSFAVNPATGQVNPQGGATRGLAAPTGTTSWENSQELQRWLYDDREQETVASSLTLDVIFSGQSGIQLPGGEIGWALGVQGRQLESRETIPSDFYNGATPCQWPGQDPIPQGQPGFNGCEGAGPFVFFAPEEADRLDQQQQSIFGELQIPVLDTLNFSAAVRHEEFSGGIGDTVYKVSGKWDIWGPLSVRGSYGTNYLAPPLGLQAGEVTNGVTNYALAGNSWLPSITVTDSSITAATATAWNAGVIWQSQGFAADHDFRFIVDYFDIETENEFRQLATTNQILNAVYSTTDAFTNCNHPLAGRVRYQDTTVTPGGACSTAITTGATGTLQSALASVSTVFGNGPGVLTNGLDYQIDYSLPIAGGDFTIGATATQVLELSDTAAILDGFTVEAASNRLGELNLLGAARAAPEWSVNAFSSYRLDRHVLRLQADWRSKVVDDRPGIQYGENGEDPIYVDFIYLFDITDNLRLTAAVENIFDRDPAKHEIEYGYDARLGSALGRTIEIGVKTTF